MDGQRKVHHERTSQKKDYPKEIKGFTKQKRSQKEDNYDNLQITLHNELIQFQ